MIKSTLLTILINLLFLIALYFDVSFTNKFLNTFVALLFIVFNCLLLVYIKKIKLISITNKIIYYILVIFRLVIQLNIILIVLTTLIISLYKMNSMVYSDKVYNFPNDNSKSLKIVLFNDGGKSGPSYVVYEQKLLLGLRCSRNITYTLEYSSNFDLERIYKQLEDQTIDTCGINLRVYKYD